jgi:lipid-A-disaccharide synthase-like uncharacterized protein
MIFDIEPIWLAIGFLGQGLFFARFLVQWVHSERLGRSAIPLIFWFFSLGGSALLLSYGIYRRDPVIIVGQCTGFIVYLRNLWLIRRERAGGGTDASHA